jgi:hypothetical protein
MMNSWWFLWMAFMFIFLVTPMSYGWGYRGWGPPYPRYVQRRRGSAAATAGGGVGTFDHHAWGLGGDLLWIVICIGGIWAVSTLWFSR